MVSGCNYKEKQRTQGRKGEKMPRINMAFTPTNLEYLHVMAAIQGASITRFCNDLIEQSRKGNRDAYGQAKQLIERMKD